MSRGARLRSIQRCVRSPSQARPTVALMRRARRARVTSESAGSALGTGYQSSGGFYGQLQAPPASSPSSGPSSSPGSSCHGGL